MLKVWILEGFPFCKATQNTIFITVMFVCLCFCVSFRFIC